MKPLRLFIAMAGACAVPVIASAQPVVIDDVLPPVDVEQGNFLGKAEVEKALAERFAQKKTAVFGSRDGNDHGMDSDSAISFEPDGGIVLGEHGVGYQGYRGKYRVRDNGTIVATFAGYKGKWPVMQMSLKEGILRLYRRDGMEVLEMGGRGGAVETSEMKPFWPFRFLEKETSSPSVTPVWGGGILKSFAAPVLPEGFKWQPKNEDEEKIDFRLDLTISPKGTVKVRQYWTYLRPSNQFPEGDWRLPVLKCAVAAAEAWSFHPYTQDGEPMSMGCGWNVELTWPGGIERWRILDNATEIYDSNPRAGL